MALTAQQVEIENAKLEGVIRVNAFAGTGKTTTLAALAKVQAKSGVSGLYLAFNTGAVLEARERFPKSWVTVKTINGLAHSVVSPRYRSKFRGYSLKSIEVIKFMDLAWNWAFARMVLDTFNFWCSSDLYEFPTTAMSIQGTTVGNPDHLRYAAVIAKQLWDRSIDQADAVPISHDGILKLYQLSQPRLAYPYVMLDEAQDTNKVTWDILKRQSCPIVVVGDTYQSINQFRGAFNAMDNVDATATFPLTQSFRFGEKVSSIANCLLNGFYGENIALEGFGPNTQVGLIDQSSPHAIISRTNAAIFPQAVEAMQAGKRIGFIGGVQAYNFGKIIDAWFLQSGNKAMIKDSFIREFESFAEFEEYAEDANDLETKRTIGAVLTYGSQVLDIVPAIHAAAEKDLSKAFLTLSTAHRVKGATLRSVRLADDFPDLIDSALQPLKPPLIDLQEVNLAYVALTRASHSLQLNQSMIDFLQSRSFPMTRYDKQIFEWDGDDSTDAKEPKPSSDRSARSSRVVPKAWLPEPGNSALDSVTANGGEQKDSDKPFHLMFGEVSTHVKKKAAPTAPANQFDLFN